MAENCSHYVKDTLLKAIHNKKTTIISFIKLFPLCQRYSFESNSQLCPLLTKPLKNCSHYVKDTLLKAIHNTSKVLPAKTIIVPTMSKILI